MRVSWGKSKPYSRGVNQGVLYSEDGSGVAWNGLISVTEKGDESPGVFYLDGCRFRNRFTPSSSEGTISALTYPDEFEPCIGIQSGWISSQPKASFGFSYRDNRELHIVYGVTVASSSDQYKSLGGDVNNISFSWDFTTVPQEIPGGRASSHLVIMLDYAQPGALSDLEDILYGNDVDDASLPDVETVISMFESYVTVLITDNGDGTWTASGPDSLVSATGSLITIDGAFVTILDSDTYKIRSL